MEEAEQKLISENKEEDDDEEEEEVLQVKRSRHSHAKNGDIENDEAAEFINSNAVYFQGTKTGDGLSKTRSSGVESFSNPDLLTAVEMSYEEENTNGDYLIEDIEVDEGLDVEGVIEKQKIYDFICPDCHSCITKRVILVKRKRKFPIRPRTENPPEQVIPEHDVEQDQGRVDNIEEPETDGMAFPSLLKPNKIQTHPTKIVSSHFLEHIRGQMRKQPMSSKMLSNRTNSSQSPENIVSATVPLADTTIDISVKPEEGVKDGSNGVVQAQSTQEPLLDKSETQVDKVATDKDGLASTVNYFVSPSVQVIYNGNEDAKEDQKVGKDSLNSSIKDDRLPETVIPQTLLDADAADQSKTGSSTNVISTERGPQAAAPEGGEGTCTQSDTRIDMSEAVVPEASEWDILKSTVYGGLIESITSLGVVSSAAGAGAKTLNILGLALANLIGGLFVIAHHLGEMRNDSSTDRYVELVGRRDKFKLHLVIVIFSFLVFGAIPPVIYGFSFRESDDRDLKLAVVAASSLVCITLLAAGKAHFQNPPKSHFKTIMYYVGIGFMTSGVSYVVGDLFDKLLEYLGLFEPTKLEHHGWSPY